MEIARDRGLPRVADAHHTTTRGAGGTARHLVPLCRHHHDQVGTRPAWVGIDLPRLAARLWLVGSTLPPAEEAR